jgi:hypothetical protein
MLGVNSVHRVGEFVSMGRRGVVAGMGGGGGRHDISSSEVSEACNATEFNHASFAEGMEVSLKLKVDMVGFVVWYTAALRLLLIFRKIGTRKIDELVW